MEAASTQGRDHENQVLLVFAFGLVIGAVTATAQLLFSNAESFQMPAVATVSAIGTAAACGRLLARRQREYVVALQQAATTDPLTGLLNRRGFQERIEIELARVNRGHGPLSLLVADLDDFKLVNDRLGHLGGDMALERAAGELRRHSRAVDAVARLGGDEFAVLLPDTGLFQALSAAERLRNRVERSFKGTAAGLTMTVGIATSAEGGRSLEELLDAADRAMYMAKSLGKNRCGVHRQAPGETDEVGEASLAE